MGKCINTKLPKERCKCMECTLRRIHGRMDHSGIAEFEARAPEQEKEKLKEALRERAGD